MEPLVATGLILQGRHIVLALSGGVACYKAAELCRLLVKSGASVQVIMSEAATRFVTPTTMQALSGRPVFTDMWDARASASMVHIDLTRQADLMIVAPASADLMARLAQGRANDLLALTCMARPIERCPLLVAPAMNREMWTHPATQRNLAQIRQDGAVVVGPGHGDQACGEVGDGRLLEPQALHDAIVAHLQPKLLRGTRVMVTAGPTYEAIDPVRGITNLSSGKMGFAIAAAAAQAGAEVTLVAGPVALATPWGVARRIDVRSALEMHAAVMAQAPACDLFVATAAVADWRPSVRAEEKIKKSVAGSPSLKMTENPDILRSVAAMRGGPYCVGFAAESHDVLAHARAKRLRKGIPLIVANHGPSTFGADDNALVLIDAAGERTLERADKTHLARQLVQHVAQRLPAKARMALGKGVAKPASETIGLKSRSKPKPKPKPRATR
jgi:phosphopantothenoylcysteine decarboxylase / phosphopantothenate---cysteine ligase